MSEYVSKAFMVLVHIPVENRLPERESFVVGCATRDEAEAKIRSLCPPEPDRLFALARSALETETNSRKVDQVLVSSRPPGEVSDQHFATIAGVILLGSAKITSAPSPIISRWD
jgi:hypothetical protein